MADKGPHKAHVGCDQTLLASMSLVCRGESLILMGLRKRESPLFLSHSTYAVPVVNGT